MIDWDESTYILIGQGILEGHLPYTELWDVKPPLLFFTFAAIVGLVGKSIVGIRIVGSLFLSTAAFFVFLSARKLGTTLTGLIAAILFIFMTGEMGGRAIMSEIIAILPLTAAFYVAITQNKSSKLTHYFLLGILLLIATLVRLNLAYLDLVVFIYHLLYWLKERKITWLKNIIALSIGFSLPILSVTIPFLVTDHLQMFYQSVIEAALSYSSSQVSRAETTRGFLQEGFNRGNIFLWLTLVGGIAIVAREILWNPTANPNRKPLILLTLWLFAITISIVSSGNIYGHYIIQILPFLTTLSAIFLSADFWGRFRYPIMILFCIGISNLFTPLVEEYRSALAKVRNGISLSNDQGYRLARFLEEFNPRNEPVYLMEAHIAYWLSDTAPIDRIVAHPSTIAKEYLLRVMLGEKATTESMMADILNKQPLYIVKTLDLLYLREHPKTVKLLNDTIARDYRPVTRIDDLYIYERRERGREN